MRSGHKIDHTLERELTKNQNHELPQGILDKDSVSIRRREHLQICETLIVRVKAFPPFSVRNKCRIPTPGGSAINKTAFKKVFLLQKQVLSLFYFVYKLKKAFGPFYCTYLISEKEAPKQRTGPAMNHSVLCLWFGKGAWVSS